MPSPRRAALAPTLIVALAGIVLTPAGLAQEGSGGQEPPEGQQPPTGQEQPPVSQDVSAAEEAFFDQLRAEGISLDLEHREIRVRGTLCRSRPDPERPVELGLVSKEGSVHEALGIVDCTPSLLNACFLWIGLTPGKPRQYVAREPEPSIEDIDLGLELPYRVLPPEGDRVFCFVRWIDEEGNERIEALENLLLQPRTREPLPMRGFVYIGSRFADHLGKEIYVADAAGNVALVFPDKAFPQDCLLDVFATTSDDYRGVDVDPRITPPAGTALEYIFTTEPMKGARPVEPPDREPVVFPDAAEVAARSRNPVLKEADPQLVEKLGVRTLADYRRMLRRGEPELRELVCAVLGVCGRPEAPELLGQQLRYDRSEEVRLSAAWGLVEIADDDALAELLHTLEEAWWAPREDAVFAFRLLSGEDRGRTTAAWAEWIAQRDPQR